jgi:hypothetical protein
MSASCAHLAEDAFDEGDGFGEIEYTRPLAHSLQVGQENFPKNLEAFEAWLVITFQICINNPPI